jgi:hypothetical protein
MYLLQVLRYWDPRLACYLHGAGLEPELYAVPFLTTLAADNLGPGPGVAASLWDAMLATTGDDYTSCRVRYLRYTQLPTLLLQG